MAGHPLKTEAVVLRSMRYGEADRILHLYTPHRGKLGAIAKGVRRSRSRFGGRLEPFFRVELMLHEGRSDLLTVTGAQTIEGHARLRADAACLDSASRACDAVTRLFDDGDPHPDVFNLLCHELALLDEDGRAHATDANQLAFRLKLLLAAGLAPQLAACAACGEREHLSGFSGAAGGVVCGACEAGAFALDEEAHALHGRGARQAAGAGPAGARARPAPGRPRDRARPPGTTRGCSCARPGWPASRPPGAGRIADGMSTAAATQWVYDFAEGSRDMRDLLGGKGANVAEMTRVLGADRVPAGFTITTEACVAYMRADRDLPDGLDEQVAEALARLEEHAGKRLGDPEDPLLVSVRSGARESMPGMLDTVLNLGLNDESVEGLAARTGNERFAWDSYRRFVQMYGNVVLGVPGERFEAEIKGAKSQRGVTLDTELDVAALRELVDVFKGYYAFPEDPQEQLRGAIRAVFDSWMGERAVAYRRINRIPDDWGTAVNVQQMVFGNKGDTSGSGVAFSRDEVTGAPEPSGDFLVNAQGEDVVSGVRNTQDIADLAELMPEVHAELLDILRTLERHYGDMQDTEFTVEEGRLYMLQTRNAKRPAQAAVRFAVDAVGEGLLTGRRRWPRSTPRSSTRCCTRRSTRAPSTTCWPAASRRRRARPRARSSSPRPTPWPPAPTAARSCSCARSPRPTTSPASTPPRASSPARAARPRTRRSSRAAWASRR